MKVDIRCATAQMTVTQAAALMRDEQIGFLPICDEWWNVIGTLTDRDIAIRVVADDHAANQPLERFMSHGAVTCRSGDDLSAAQDLMGEMRVSRIVCVSENGRLEGVISLSDIAQHQADAGAQTLREVTTRESHAH